MKCGGIVLCGGRSTRMGIAKPSLPFGPEPMLVRVVRLLGDVVQPVVVVAAQGQPLPELPDGTLLAHDRREDRGPLEGLFAGLSAITDHADAAYATGCDVPLLSGDFVRLVIESLGEHQIAVPKEGRFHHPLAAVYRTGVLPDIEALLAADRLRPALLFDRTDTREVAVERLREVDPELATLRNVNRPEDYLAALSSAGFEAPAEVIEKLQ